MIVTADQLAGAYDLAVIGAGPAGLSLAREYAALTDKRALVVESGPARQTAGNPAQALAQADATGFYPASYYSIHSQRSLGGTSNVWAGYSIALERRAFLAGEWPIAYEELSRHYPAVAEILRLPRNIHTAPEIPLDDAGAVVYRPLPLSLPVVRFNAGNRRLMRWLTESSQVSLLCDHTATAARIAGGRCQGVTLRATRKAGAAAVTVNAARTVVAAGGVQNARFLLLSLPDGQRLPIGRHLAMHPLVQGRQFPMLIDQAALQRARAGAGITRKREDAIALSSEFCAANGLLSSFYFFQPGALGSPSLQNLGGRRRMAVPVGVQELVAEMPLLRDNRVRLSPDKKDFLGQPAMMVDFNFHRQSIEAMHQALAAQLARSGLGRLGPLPADWKIIDTHGGGHLLCTTRMGRSPADSVVDGNCQVHGVRNLYVAGSSVFAAAAAANPTHAIIALALRLAHHLAGGAQ